VPANMATIKLIARNWAGWNLLSALIGCLLFKPSSLSWFRYQIYYLIKILSIEINWGQAWPQIDFNPGICYFF
jgi:hypothetical protein